MMFYPMARTVNVRTASRTRKMVKNEIFGALIMARSARGSVRAPKIISDSKTAIKIDAF